MVDTSGEQRQQKFCFEDYQLGSVYEFGPITVKENEMIEFARRYDPQVFHTDPEAARQSSFGGLVASGWYTAVLAMRLLVDNNFSFVETLGSPGLDELRWLKPVRPGDLLSVRLTIIGANRSRSKPDRGVVRESVKVLNQAGEVVMSWKGLNMVRCRGTS
jgi:acyl dehydratase